MFDQDEAAMSKGTGAEETERVREAGPLRREESWAPKEGEQRVLVGPQRLRRQECIRLRVRVGVRVRVRV